MKIAVIGCGNMAQSLVEGFYSHHKEYSFYLYTPSRVRAKELASKVQGSLVEDFMEFKDLKIDYWLLGMKPQNLSDFQRDFEKLKIKNAQIISMLAATRLENLKKRLQTNYVTRIMPNTPVKYSKGVSLVSHAKEVSSEQKAFLNTFLKTTSEVYELSETELEKATVLSGSGPAYFYLFTQSLASAMAELGIDQKLAINLAKQTLIGAATLVSEERSKDLQEMIDAVTSRGGVTIEAVNSFKEEKLRELSLNALMKAYQRSLKLSEELG